MWDTLLLVLSLYFVLCWTIQLENEANSYCGIVTSFGFKVKSCNQKDNEQFCKQKSFYKELLIDETSCIIEDSDLANNMYTFCT